MQSARRNVQQEYGMRRAEAVQMWYTQQTQIQVACVDWRAAYKGCWKSSSA